MKQEEIGRDNEVFSEEDYKERLKKVWWQMMAPSDRWGKMAYEWGISDLEWRFLHENYAVILKEELEIWEDKIKNWTQGECKEVYDRIKVSLKVPEEGDFWMKLRGVGKKEKRRCAFAETWWYASWGAEVRKELEAKINEGWAAMVPDKIERFEDWKRWAKWASKVSYDSAFLRIVWVEHESIKKIRGLEVRSWVRELEWFAELERREPELAAKIEKELGRFWNAKKIEMEECYQRIMSDTKANWKAVLDIDVKSKGWDSNHKKYYKQWVRNSMDESYWAIDDNSREIRNCEVNLRNAKESAFNWGKKNNFYGSNYWSSDLKEVLKYYGRWNAEQIKINKGESWGEMQWIFPFHWTTMIQNADDKIKAQIWEDCERALDFGGMPRYWVMNRYSRWSNILKSNEDLNRLSEVSWEHVREYDPAFKRLKSEWRERSRRECITQEDRNERLRWITEIIPKKMSEDELKFWNEGWEGISAKEWRNAALEKVKKKEYGWIVPWSEIEPIKKRVSKVDLGVLRRSLFLEMEESELKQWMTIEFKMGGKVMTKWDGTQYDWMGNEMNELEDGIIEERQKWEEQWSKKNEKERKQWILACIRCLMVGDMELEMNKKSCNNDQEKTHWKDKMEEQGSTVSKILSYLENKRERRSKGRILEIEAAFKEEDKKRMNQLKKIEEDPNKAIQWNGAIKEMIAKNRVQKIQEEKMIESWLERIEEIVKDVSWQEEDWCVLKKLCTQTLERMIVGNWISEIEVREGLWWQERQKVGWVREAFKGAWNHWKEIQENAMTIGEGKRLVEIDEIEILKSEYEYEAMIGLIEAKESTKNKRDPKGKRL